MRMSIGRSRISSTLASEGKFGPFSIIREGIVNIDNRPWLIRLLVGNYLLWRNGETAIISEGRGPRRVTLIVRVFVKG